MNAWALIPARGGSQRVTRKNLRVVGGTPLIVRAITTAQTAGLRPVVSTDDVEISTIATLAGAEVHARPDELAGPTVTIAQVVDQWACENMELDDDSVVVVLQPTCPFIEPDTLTAMVERVHDTGNSVALVAPERHLLRDEHSVRLYGPRVNSTTIEALDASYYREVGVFAFAAGAVGDTFPPGPVTMAIVDGYEALDIDTPADLWYARRACDAAVIEIRYLPATAGRGSGHEYRARAIAAELEHHDVVLLPCTEQGLPLARHFDNFDDEPAPAVIVFDCLGATPGNVGAVRQRWQHAAIVAIENEGSGNAYADVVIHPFDPSVSHFKQNKSGGMWADLRGEFVGWSPRDVRTEPPYTIVVTFGGSDPHGGTTKVLDVLRGMNWSDPGVAVRLIEPPYGQKLSDDPIGRYTVVRHPVMAAELRAADLAITSRGRTVYEAMACGTPTIAVAANEREVLHRHAPFGEGAVMYASGRINDWGHGEAVDLATMITAVLNDHEKRQHMSTRGMQLVDGRGTERIAHLIDTYARRLR